MEVPIRKPDNIIKTTIRRALFALVRSGVDDDDDDDDEETADGEESLS